jgi:RNA polymerase sigma factor (sigma-70 family)
VRRSTYLHTGLSELDRMAARLPFDLDDGAAVGALYQRWIRKRRGKARYQIDLWTYCYVRRYFLIRFVHTSRTYTNADVDYVVERAFSRIESKRSTLREETRYPHWVTVVCRNTYLNFISRHPDHVGVDRVAEPEWIEDEMLRVHDDAIRASALAAAIERLPNYLQSVIRMKLVEGLEYQVIGDRTGAPTASVRAYVHKALVRLRRDTELLTVLGYGLSPQGSEG